MVSYTDAEFWYMAAVGAGLVLFGGLMSGLTLGLLSLDEMDMAVIERSGSEVEKARARKIKTLISNQHMLLVTLLLCNAGAMEALPLILDELVSPIVAVLISVTAVLAFGEIIPQAICKSYGMAVGAFAAPLVWLLILICSPLAWPIGKLLDCALGHEGGRLYKRPQIKAIVDIHNERGQLTADEANVMQGALELAEKRCVACMTPIDHVKTIRLDAKLDSNMMDFMLEAGHSRFPVTEAGRIVGILLMKSLIRYVPDDATPVAELKLFPVAHISEEAFLSEILDVFQTGRTHMAAVYRHGEFGGRGDIMVPPDSANAIGIVTLEDVIEELIKEDIIDETDVYVHVDAPVSPAREVRKAGDQVRSTPGGHLRLPSKVFSQMSFKVSPHKDAISTCTPASQPRSRERTLPRILGDVRNLFPQSGALEPLRHESSRSSSS